MFLSDIAEKPLPASVLKANQLLKGLSTVEMERLARASRPVHALRGEVIWLNGAQVDFVGVASDGWIKMIRNCPSGNDLTLEIYGPGQMFGLTGALLGTGCPLSAQAVTDLWYLRVPKTAMQELYEANANFRDAVFRRTATRLHRTVDLLARMSCGRVEERIAVILFILADSYGVKESSGVRLQVPLTRQEIGEMSGTTVESTIRTLSRWQKEGLITTDHHHIVILDESRLSEVIAH